MANGTEDLVFNELAKYPERQKRYADAMRFFNTGPDMEPVHLLDNYPWESLGNGTIVDVGGSHGDVSIAIAQRFSSVHCIVQDRPEVIVEGRNRIPASLATRVSFMEHDFFSEQPVKDADVYYFRWIFHDWSDKYTVQILRSLIPALKAGAKIVVNEQVLPEPGAVSQYQERFIR